MLKLLEIFLEQRCLSFNGQKALKRRDTGFQKHIEREYYRRDGTVGSRRRSREKVGVVDSALSAKESSDQ